MDDPLSGRYADLGVGLLLGLAAALACAAAWAWRRRHLPGAATPVAGLALAAAGAIGLAAIGGGPTTLALPWPAIAVAAGVAGVLLADFDRRWQRLGLALPLLAISAAGIYATVPDVEAAVVVLGAALPMSLLGWPGPLARSRHGRARRQPAADAPAQPPPSLGRAGALATAGLLVWTVTTGSVGRSSSVVGGLGCLGLLAVEPIARLLDPRRRSPLASLAPRQVPWSALATHLLLVGVAARVVGRQTTVQGALLLGVLALAGALAAALVVCLRRAVGDRMPS
jgi:hypothetical protein